MLINRLNSPVALIVAAVVLAASVSASLAADAPSTRPTSYFGQVIAPDGKPVIGAVAGLIQYRQDNGSYYVVATVSSDAQGKFQFNAQLPYTTPALAIVRAPKFAVTGGPLQDSTAENPIVFRPQLSTEIRVTFADSNGNPISGMRVWPYYITERSTGRFAYIPVDWRNQFAQTTDVSGSCVFKDLPRGASFDYRFSDPRYARQLTEDRIVLGEVPVSQAVIRRLVPAGSIEGRVVFADAGKPVQGVSILATGEEQHADGTRSTWSMTTATDADGKYILRGTRAGQYVIRAQLRADQLAQFAGAPLEVFAVDSSQRVIGKDIALVSGGIIRGKVIETRTAAPVPNARIMVFRIIMGATTRRFSEGSTTTGDDGSYLLHAVPGEIELDLSGLPQSFVSLSSSTTQPTQRTAVVNIVDRQTITRDFEVPPSPFPTLKGRVVDSAGQAVVGATVILEAPPRERNEPPRAISQPDIRTDSAGLFKYPGVPVGSSVRAFKGTSGTASRAMVDEGNHDDLKVTLQNNVMTSMGVQITDNGGKPITSAQVQVLQTFPSANFELPRATTGEDGKVVVSPLFPDVPNFIIVTAKGYGRGTRSGVQASLGKQADVVMQLAKADSFVAGMLLDQNQLPLADMEVTINSSRTGIQTVKTDITGHFRAEGLVAGENVSIYTHFNGKSLPSNRVAVGTSDAIIIHDPAAIPTSRPADRGR